MMKRRSRFVQTVDGATTTVTLTSNDVGWEVKGWRYTVGEVKTVAEGDPFLHDTFTDRVDAVAAYRAACHDAVDEPGQPFTVSDRRVALGTQVLLDEAGADDWVTR